MSQVPTPSPSSSPPSLLAYAPPAKDPKAPLAVIVCGLISTGLTLVGVYLLNTRTESNVMGWYVNYVLPAGALIVGLAAAAGYGLASWVTGVKIRKGVLWTILLLQLAAYWVAQYIEFVVGGPWFTQAGRPVGFFEFYHINAISFAWAPKVSSGKPGEPLGMWGYAFRLLEMAGFAGGGLIVPAVMAKAAYCDLCQVYMRTRRLATIAATVPARKVKKSDTAGQAAYAEEQQAALDAGQARLTALNERALAGDEAGFRQALAALKADEKRAGKLPGRINVSLVSCKNCKSGTLTAALAVGQGNQTKDTPIQALELHPEFVRAVEK